MTSIMWYIVGIYTVEKKLNEVTSMLFLWNYDEYNNYFTIECKNVTEIYEVEKIHENWLYMPTRLVKIS